MLEKIETVGRKHQRSKSIHFIKMLWINSILSNNSKYRMKNISMHFYSIVSLSTDISFKSFFTELRFFLFKVNDFFIDGKIYRDIGSFSRFKNLQRNIEKYFEENSLIGISVRKNNSMNYVLFSFIQRNLLSFLLSMNSFLLTKAVLQPQRHHTEKSREFLHPA